MGKSIIRPEENHGEIHYLGREAALKLMNGREPFILPEGSNYSVQLQFGIYNYWILYTDSVAQAAYLRLALSFDSV